jgi:hypothetical protein
MDDGDHAVRVAIAATFGGFTSTTHAIKGEFDYSRIADARTLCGRKGPFSTRHNMNSDVEVTCKSCLSVPRELVSAYSWNATAHLEQSFGFSPEDASALINRAMSGKGFRGGLAIAGNSRAATPVEFTTHQGRRRWVITAWSVGFVSATMIDIKEITCSR